MIDFSVRAAGDESICPEDVSRVDVPLKASELSLASAAHADERKL